MFRDRDPYAADMLSGRRAQKKPADSSESAGLMDSV